MTPARAHARRNALAALAFAVTAGMSAPTAWPLTIAVGYVAAVLTWNARAHWQRHRDTARGYGIARHTVIPDPAPMPDWETRVVFDAIIRNSFEEQR